MWTLLLDLNISPYLQISSNRGYRAPYGCAVSLFVNRSVDWKYVDLIQEVRNLI